ncbi:MAG: His-Xaa-Ser system radical SAM maturase HxsB [Planctomycetes bacterium]|nr:His-Xaa-Ser system radical SAM maturase HxsB [Planctomycetota bacterium]
MATPILLPRFDARVDPPRDVNFLRFRELDEGYVISNDLAHHHFLTPDEFNKVLGGTLEAGNPLRETLTEKGFFHDPGRAHEQVSRVAGKNHFVMKGTSLHILVITLRCNYDCTYCHASRVNMDRQGFDMTENVARQVVDQIFRSSAPDITIEFQGGEPLVNFAGMRLVIERAIEKNRSAGKTVMFSLVSNLSLLDDATLDYLLEKRVQICTSLDGPAAVHDKNRLWQKGSSHRETVEKVRKIQARFKERGLDPAIYNVGAIFTTTRHAFPYWKEIVDEYVSLGIKTLHLRPLDPFGMAVRTWRQIGYTTDEYLDFYFKVVEHILSLNEKGVEISETFSSILLKKILTGSDPNFMDIRSPCGAGVGQITYNYDGRVFTCDEGRMLDHMGDPTFEIGRIGEGALEDFVGGETVRAMLSASCQDATPLCADCAYRPYCGACPVHNYATQGNPVGRMAWNNKCKTYLAVFDYLFRILRDGGQKKTALERWTQEKAPLSFLHSCS